MFGLMEFTVAFDEPIRQAIIPTFILPFTVLGMILTSLATWIAAFFGIHLKAEGPKRLFEVLMRPKVLIWALISNAIFYAGYAGYKYESNSSRPLWLIEAKNKNQAKSLSATNDLKPPEAPQAKAKKADALKRIELLWQSEIKGGVFGGIIAQGTSLFMGTTSGRLIELSSASGQTLRELWLGQPVMTAPLVLGTNIFLGEGVHETHHSRYYKFDLQTGKLLAAAQTSGHIERTATVIQVDNKNIMLIPSGKDGVHAVDADHMSILWRAPIGHVDSYPVTDGESVFVGTGLEQGFDQEGTNAYALDLKTGSVKWKKPLATSAWGMPTLWKEQICFSVGDVYKNTDYGQIACYNKNTGEELGAVNLPGAVISAPILDKDKLIIADLHGVIYQVDLFTKKIDWKISVPTTGLNYSPVVMDGADRLILPGKDGLYIYSRKSQNLLLHWQPEGKWNFAYSNILIQGDTWYLADSKGQVRALKPIFTPASVTGQ